MSSLFALLGVARDGLLAQSAGADVTGQNVSNANTPGYVRRTVELGTLGTPSGAVGGVTVVGVARGFDRFAEGRVVDEGGRGGAADARSGALANLESIVAPGQGQSIADKAAAFFANMNAVAQDPSSTTARAAALSAATNLTSSIAATSAALADASASMVGKAQGAAGEVNDRLAKVAALNEQIAAAVARGDSAADLRDQRDSLVREIGQRLPVKAIEEPDGKLTLLSSGSTLVEGNQHSTVDVSLTQAGDMKVTFTRPSGQVIDVTQKVDSGTIGGLLEARDVDGKDLRKKLDQYAFDFANAVNAQHVQGFGLDGQTGRNLFTPPAGVAGAAATMSIDPAIGNDPTRIGAAKSAGDIPGGNDVALGIAQIAGQPIGAGGTPAQEFGTVSGSIGVAKAAAENDAALRKSTLAQATSLRDSASGVSLDEEMVNLTRYQRAFEANTKVLQTANDLLDGFLKGLPA